VSGAQEAAEPSLTEILGGRSGAADAGLPAVAFVTVWAVASSVRAAADGPDPGPVLWGAGAAVLTGLVLAVFRLVRGERVAAVVLGLLGVVIAALVVLHTGRAQDFFLLQIASNAASALVWVASIVIRWPLLGVIVGLALRQRARWRTDPDLVRGYCRASWVWVAQYLVRLAVFVPLYRTDQVIALGIARGLTWVPALLCVVLSWPVLRTALPSDHPGIRYPRPRQRDNAHQQ
jgi:Protein of unknown function (DUF3159)